MKTSPATFVPSNTTEFIHEPRPKESDEPVQNSSWPKAIISSVTENVRFFYKYGGHFWNYHANLGAFIAQANESNKAKATATGQVAPRDIVHCRTDEDLHAVLSADTSQGPQHTVAVFRVKGNHNQALSIFKNQYGKISCFALDSCTFRTPLDKEATDWFDKTVLFNAANKWTSVLKSYPNSQVVIVSLGTQQDSTSCGEFAVSGAKKLQDHIEPMLSAHHKHVSNILPTPLFSALGTPEVMVTNDLNFLAQESKQLTARLLVHDQSREHLTEAVNRYGLQEIDLKNMGKPKHAQDAKTLLNRCKSGLEQKDSLYRKRDQQLNKIYLEK